MKSLMQQIAQIEGLTDTTDLTEWENTFVKDIVEKVSERKTTTWLTEKQLAIIDRIFNKHFA